MSGDALVGDIETPTLFCGEGVFAIADALRASLGDRALIAQAPAPTRRASYLAHLAHRRWQAGAADDPATLQPLYLRSSQVDTASQRWAS
jgi:tRNA A37 threonylcarbamoyladenosine modification protein TsaB